MAPPKLTEYELQRQARIARNQAVLAALDVRPRPCACRAGPRAATPSL